MKPTNSTRFIAMYRDRARRTPLLWSLAVALGALACAQAEHLGWWSHGGWWSLVPAVVAIVLAVRWYVLGRKLTATAFARHLDSEWVLQARLESSVELANEQTALAKAQRSDAHEHVQTQRPPRMIEWFGGLVALVVMAVMLTSELGVAVRRQYLVPTVIPTEVKAPVADKTPAPDRSGRINWLSPESEIKATAIEEVPLSAVAESREGYKRLTLEVALNGEARLSQSVEPAALAKIGHAGSHALSLSLYLDEIKPQEFDIVSYHLRGEIAPDAPAVVSPLQFIQIRPSRDDVAVRENGSDNSAVNVIRRLKIAQLELLKQNFLLANTPLAHDDPVWRETTTGVAGDQSALASKTVEFRDVAISDGAPSIVVDNLDQAAPLMREAAKNITLSNHEAAGKQQGKALGLITAIEKIIRKTLAPVPPPKDDDPFKDQQKYTMPERAETPAGRLEELARKQEKIARSLSENSADQVTAQSDVSRELDRLVAEKTLDPDVQIETAAAAKDAAEANRQLAQNDMAAARGPAMAAAEALGHAVAAQERIGRQKALAELDQARRELNNASQQSRSGERTAQLNKLAGDLAQAAGNQQKEGSGEAAGQLSAASKEVREAARSEASTGKSDTDRLAQMLARAETSLSGQTAALARAKHLLDRLEKELAGSSKVPLENTLNEALLAGQLAEALLHEGQGRALAHGIVTAIAASPKSGVGVDLGKLKDSVQKLIAVLDETRAKGAREEYVRRFNPEDFDPAYRSAIEAYFERLSREGSR